MRAGERRERAAGRVDLALAGNEDQDASFVHLPEELLARDRDPPLERGVVATFVPGRLDRIAAARDVQRAAGEETRQRLTVECRRHHEQEQVRTERLPHVAQHRQRQIRLDVPFVELVQHHGRDPRQLRILREPAQEDPLGHEDEPRLA